MLFVVLWGEYEKYSESPPTRLFSMTLVLSYWLGLLDASNTHELHPEAKIHNISVHQMEEND